MSKSVVRFKNYLLNLLLFSLVACIVYNFIETQKAQAQIFIPHTYWKCKDATTVINSLGSSDFSKGTFSNTMLSGDYVTLSVGQSAGTYTSQVFDNFGGCPPLTEWSELGWKTPNPYGKEIPTTDEVAIDYSNTVTGLTVGTQYYYRLNGSGAIANGASIAATIGSNATARNANGAGMTYLASGVLKNAVTLAGTDDHIEVPFTHTNYEAYSISAYVRTSSAANAAIVQNRGATGTGQSLTLSMGAHPTGCAAGKFAFGLDVSGTYIGRCTTGTYNDNAWHHVVGTWSATSGTGIAANQFAIYINGDAASMTDVVSGTATSPLTGSGNTMIGRHQSWGTFFVGSIDEVVVWNRALSPIDVQQLYQRGGNNIRFQIRTCNNSDCSDVATWKGPNNTNTTYFSEYNNNSIPDTAAGNVLSTSPTMVFNDFPSLVVDYRRYFQYQATLNTSNTTIVPYLGSTSSAASCASNTVTYTSNGTFTLPPLCTQMTVTANGGGGASGRRTGGGTKGVGGTGGRAVKTFTGLTPGTSFSVTIGGGGLCSSQAGGTGAYSGGTGGGTNTSGTDGAGTAVGGAGRAGTGTGAALTGGTGFYGGGGGGGAGATNTNAGGGGAASSLRLASTDWIVAGGGGGSGGSASGAAGAGGGGCGGAVSGDYTLGAQGVVGSGNSGGAGGGGGCYCLGGCDSASAAGAAGGDTSGVSCQAANDGSSGSVQIQYQ